QSLGIEGAACGSLRCHENILAVLTRIDCGNYACRDGIEVSGLWRPEGALKLISGCRDSAAPGLTRGLYHRLRAVLGRRRCRLSAWAGRRQTAQKRVDLGRY